MDMTDTSLRVLPTRKQSRTLPCVKWAATELYRNERYYLVCCLCYKTLEKQQPFSTATVLTRRAFRKNLIGSPPQPEMCKMWKRQRKQKRSFWLSQMAARTRYLSLHDSGSKLIPRHTGRFINNSWVFAERPTPGHRQGSKQPCESPNCYVLLTQVNLHTMGDLRG